MFSFSKKPKSVSENEPFVLLVRAAQEDETLRNQLRQIVALNDFNRRSVLNTWIERLQFESSPDARDLLQALLALREPDVAEKLKEFL